MLPIDAQLCSFCQDLLFRDRSTDEPYASLWWSELKASKDECAFCSLFYRAVYRDFKAVRRLESAVRQYGPSDLQVAFGTQQDWLASNGLRSRRVALCLPEPLSEHLRESIFTIADCDSTSTVAQEPFWQDFPTSHVERLRKTRAWLQECRETHSGCMQVLNGNEILPFRLIEVSPAGQSSPRLVKSKDLNGKEVVYATLSYCWGNSQPITTTKSSLHQLSSRLPLDDLAQTHQDAIRTTLALGIAYLWIDALCIVQDDPFDWAAEARKMDSIYSNSTLTLRANESSTSAGGLFSDPPHFKVMADERHFYMVLPNATHGSSTLVHIIDRSTTFGHISALNRRAWALQEDVLSLRTIQLTNSELHWRCKAVSSWESGIYYNDNEELHGSVPIAGVPDSPLSTANRAQYNHVWQRWVQTYFQRDLTYEADRFPAIAGLATRYESIMQEQSCFGVWRSSLHEGLAWHKSSDASGDTPTTVPSWSPFSAGQALALRNTGRSSPSRVDPETCLKCVDCKISWQDLPYVSALQDCKLTVEGAVTHVTLLNPRGCQKIYPGYVIPGAGAADMPDTKCCALFDKALNRRTSTWFCVLLSRCDHGTGYENFLILEPASVRLSGDTYRRVGFGFIHRSEDYRTLDGQESSLEGEVWSSGTQGWTFDLNRREVIHLV